MSQEEELGHLIASTIKGLVTPLLDRLAAAEARAAGVERRIRELESRPHSASVELTEGLMGAVAGLEKRVLSVETKAPIPGPEGSRGEPGPKGEQGLAGERGEKGEHGERGPEGAAGVRGEPGLHGERGEKGLDGAAGERGPEGQQGAPGRDGRDGLPGAPGQPGERGLDGKDGVNGKDGLDGLGFDDVTVEHDGERGIEIAFRRGDRVKRFQLALPVVLDRGVYRSGESYQKGDGVSFGGSFWIAQAETTEKPGDGATAWRLAVKRGRDGSEGKPGPKGERGDKGDQGEPGRIYR